MRQDVALLGRIRDYLGFGHVNLKPGTRWRTYQGLGAGLFICAHRQAEELCRRIRPHVILKRAQVELLLQYRSRFRQMDFTEREGYAKQMRELNASVARSFRKMIEAKSVEATGRKAHAGTEPSFAVVRGGVEGVETISEESRVLAGLETPRPKGKI